ncbi:hypothetical protein V1478_000248 [Vespula squamosa]|uniref:Uncharacterized protein n=1 Tax=Vespula squamosa TaxID=30214 RepID=A0ABD2C4Z1_VESSQ
MRDTKRVLTRRHDEGGEEGFFFTFLINFSIRFQIIGFTKKVASLDGLDRNLNPPISLSV